MRRSRQRSMFYERAVRLGAVAVLGGFLAVACGSEDVTFPDGDSQNLFPSGNADAGGGKDAGPKPTGDGGSGTKDAGQDSGPVIDPNYPFQVVYDSVVAGGKTQDFIALVPQQRTAASLPIIFGYHGDGGGAEDSKSYFQVEQVTKQGAIVVYPSCPANPSWNIYGGASNEWLAGFDAILEKVASTYAGDRSKVTAFGLSSGAFFASVLGCFRSDKLAAVGIMAGGAPFKANDGSTGLWVDGQDSTTKCPGQGPIPVFVAHDYSDPVVGYDSGRWASEYYLYANRAAEYGQWGGNADNTSAAFDGACVKREESPPDAPVVLCSVNGVGHALWPQFLPNFWQFSNSL